MSSRTVPFSARISIEDAEFIGALKIEGAQTPSDKLRALLADARRRHERRRDYSSNLALVEDWLGDTKRQLLIQEHKLGNHSELIARVLDWLPDMIAYILTPVEDKAPTPLPALQAYERNVAERIQRLVELIIPLIATNRRNCYDPALVLDQNSSLLRLARMLNEHPLNAKENNNE